MATFRESDLRNRVRRMADMENSAFVTDAEIRDYLNMAISELHDIVVEKYEDYFIKSTSYDLGDETELDLPEDFYKVLGVDLDSGGRTHTLKNYSFNERSMYRADPVFGLDPFAATRYHIQGNKIKFIPDNPVGNATLHYVPVATQLKETGPDQISSIIPGYEEYIVVTAAIQCLMKEESDVRTHMVRKAEIKERIESAAGKRNAGDSYAITDIDLGAHVFDRRFF